MEEKQRKMLGLVGTPIGNLSDASPRVLEFLKNAQCFVCEDTRETKKLLKLLEIEFENKVFLSFHEHNQDQVQSLVGQALEHDTVALLSDAGSPVLSDPGFPFVKEWIARGESVASLPGPSAVLIALELSGLAPIPFQFHGFLPRKKEATQALAKSLPCGVTHVLFESPHRIKKSLEVLTSLLPDSEFFVGRELTKKFEEHYRFKGVNYNSYVSKIHEKGEFVLVLRKPENKTPGKGQGEHWEKLKNLSQSYLKKPSPKGLSRLISLIEGKEPQEIYERLSKTNNL